MQFASQIGVSIIDDNQWEPDEEFFVKLSLIPGKDSEEVRLGRTSIMEITILNDDGTIVGNAQPNFFSSQRSFLSEPGLLQFEKRGHLVKESCGDADISIARQNGADGLVSVKWRTIDKTAINGKDYKGGEGIVEFNHGEVTETRGRKKDL